MLNEYNYNKQLTWLIRLRWAAIAGQTILFTVSTNVLNISIPFAHLWYLLLFISLSNIGLHFYKSFVTNISKISIGSTLVLDTFLLTIALALSGGPANPFSIVYLLHVSIAALLLGSSWTWIMVALSTSCFGLLFKFHVMVPELSMHSHDSAENIAVHLYGMLISFSLVAVLSGYFLAKMSEALKAQEREIGELKLDASHHERLTSLTTLSAGAAHELSTPLATISLAASELGIALRKIPATSDMLEDAELIIEQINRCKSILEDMSGQSGVTIGEMPQIIEHKELLKAIEEKLGEAEGEKFLCKSVVESEIFAPKNGLSRALASLIRNGIDACRGPSCVELIVNHAGKWIDFSVVDNGDGISAEVLRQVGDPFFTTKEPGKGMGLGVFLVKLFATRLGGTFSITSQIGKGTRATIRIPQAV